MLAVIQDLTASSLYRAGEVNQPGIISQAAPGGEAGTASLGAPTSVPMPPPRPPAVHLAVPIHSCDTTLTRQREAAPQPTREAGVSRT